MELKPHRSTTSSVLYTVVCVCRGQSEEYNNMGSGNKTATACLQVGKERAVESQGILSTAFSSFGPG